MIEVTKRFTFEAAHRLYKKFWDDQTNAETFGPCNRLHGHSYKLLVTVEGDPKVNGMVINFSKLGEVVNREIIDKLDHQYLNDVIGDDEPLTCENMLPWIAERLKPFLPGLKKLKLYETEKCFAVLKV